MVNGIVRVVKGNQGITRGCYAIEAKKSNANTLAGCARKLKKKRNTGTSWRNRHRKYKIRWPIENGEN